MSSRDVQLVARAQNGDRDAFNELVLAHQLALYNLVLRLVGSRADAADITQEAFLRAWEKLRTLRGGGFKPWVFQIAVNLCRDTFRQRKRLVVSEDPLAESGGIPMNARPLDPIERAESGERMRLVRESILALDHDLRLALVLRDVSGLAYEEIAEVLKVPLGTVKSRIARARAHVQERLLLYPELFELPLEDSTHGN